MAESLGTAVLNLDAKSSALKSKLGSAKASIASFSKGGVASVALVGAAVVTAGVGLFKLGEKFDDAYDTIRVGTGATGKSLEGLKDDFKNVVSEVPADFGDAGTAIADINTRLGVTGKPLRSLSKQFLELSRITGDDLGKNIETVSVAFEDWGVKTKDQSGALDKFFRASQASGASVGDLSTLMQKFGSPLRQLGFNFDQSLAMFSSFQKAGVNLQTAMPGLKMALSNFAKAGKDPKVALQKTIKELGNMDDKSKATAKAIKVFGQRAGPDIAEAINQGRFSFEDMQDTIVNGKDTIRAAGKDTMDLKENLQILKNKGFVLLEPVATAVFNTIGKGSAWLVTALTDLQTRGTAAFGSFEPLIQALIITFEIVFLAIKGFLDGFIQAIEGTFEIIGGILDVFSGLFTGDFNKMWKGIKRIFKGAVNVVIGTVGQLTAPIRAVAEKIGLSWEALADLAALIWNTIKSVVLGAWDAIKTAASSVWNAIKNTIVGAWGAAKDATTSGINSIVNFVTGLPGKLILALGIIATKLKEKASAIWQAFKNGMMEKVGAIVSFVHGIPGKLVSALGNIATKLKGVASRAWQAFKNGMMEKADAIVSFAKGIPASIKSGIGNLGSILVGAGKAIFSGLLKGLKSKWKSVKKWLKKATKKIPKWKGPLSDDLRLLVPAGAAIMEGLGVGMERQFASLQSEISAFSPRISASFTGDTNDRTGETGSVNLTVNTEGAAAEDPAVLAREIGWEIATR